MQSRATGLLAWVVVIITTVCIAASCSSKKGESKEQAKASTVKEEPKMVSSPPPAGQWKAVEEKSGVAPMALTVNFDKYSSAVDIKMVSESSSPSDLKAKIENFDSHGGMQIGQQFKTQDGKPMVVGQFWSPQFITARLSGDAWKITIVRGSPFIEKEKTRPQEVGFIELTVPVKGGGGSARLYIASEVAYEKGQLVPKAPESEAKVLKITSFVPSEKLK